MEILTQVPQRVLAIYAHPDDADVSCGGTLAKWSSLDSEVELIVCASGEKGSVNVSLNEHDLIEIRKDEVNIAARHLGVNAVTFLQIPDGEVSNDLSLRRILVNKIRNFQPEVVIAPDPTAIFFGDHYYNHRDHRETGWAALDAVAPAASSPLYFQEEGAPHQVSSILLSGTLEPSIFVDITASIEEKEKAIRSHISQLGESSEWLRSVVRERAQEAGDVAGLLFAEGFRRVRF
ncbi:MAG: PIG-L family deacetylase [Firmicutes bacterium]|nr:PIG-L family deacetylase [Bacillota bacterium]